MTTGREPLGLLDRTAHAFAQFLDGCLQKIEGAMFGDVKLPPHRCALCRDEPKDTR